MHKGSHSYRELKMDALIVKDLAYLAENIPFWSLIEKVNIRY